MRAVIIGSSLDGITTALRLKRNGFEVDMLTSSTYVCEDYTGTWKYFPACKQKDGLDRLNKALRTIGYSDVAFPLLPGKLKKLFCEILLDSSINLHYMTRVVGVSISENRISGILFADKHGMHEINCDLVVDATIYGEFICLINGVIPTIRGGKTASLLLEYNGLAGQISDVELSKGITLYQGVVSVDSAYVRLEKRFENAVSISDARNELLLYAANCLPELVQYSELRNAKLQSAFSSCINAEVETVDNSQYENVYTVSQMADFQIDYFHACSDEADHKLFRINEKDNQITTDVLVIGGGTAGIRAAEAAAKNGAKVCIAEFFSTLGGTRTVGNIQPPYYGNRNDLFLKMWKQITDYASITGGMKGVRTSPVSEALLYEKEMRSLGIRVLRPAIAYEAPTVNGVIDHVSFATESGCVRVQAKIYVDATGDADIAMFAGVDTITGSEDLQLTQNYSQTHRYSGTDYDRVMADQDIVDINDSEDIKRALDKNNLNSGQYDITEMLTVRESRRIVGRDCIKLSDVFRGKTGPDTIYEAMSDYDTHSRCFTMAGRFGVLAMHAPIKFTSIPYGALLPKQVDNLLVCGKALSVEQDLIAYLRMCPDIMCLGYATGMAAAQAALSGAKLSEIDIAPIQRFMLDHGGILHKPPTKTEFAQTPQMIAMRLAAGEEMAITDAILCDYPEIVDQLHKLQDNNALTNQLYSNEILLYYGDKTAAPIVAAKLEELDRSHGNEKHSDYLNGKLILGGSTYYQDIYWQINLMVMLLAKAGCREYADTIRDVMKNAVIGEAWDSHNSPYMNLRPDTQTHGNFDRMLCLAYAACLMPSDIFGDEIVRLVYLNREANTMNNYPYEWLDIKLCEAAYLCGAKEGAALISEHLNSRYSIMRKHAKKVLGK